MSQSSRSYGKSRDTKCKAIHLLVLLIVINSATAIDYAAYRRDAVPRGTHRQTSITTRNILEQLNRRNGTSRPTLQDATEHLLQYGALLRIEILDTFGRLVYDHYDDFGMRQIEALYRVYSETLERKYNIFDIVPSVLADADMRPTRVCAHINKHVRTCLKESSQVCTGIKIRDEAHASPYEKPASDSTRRIYRTGQISKNYPNGFSLKAVLHHLRAGRLRLTASLVTGLLRNVQYDHFDDNVRTAERELIAYLGEPSTTWITTKLEKTIPRGRKVSELLKNYLSSGSKLFAGRAADRASYLSKHVTREVDAVSENIELLGTVYDNSTINLKYLFELVLPNDWLPPDVLEARDYLLRELTTRKIVETYLTIEKYQQNGPDQLLLEILGQLRDIGFAEDLVTSLHAHARFWHKSHMVENVNELLELFDAYENLREVKKYRGLVNASRVIKKNLRNSENVTVELLCSRPRECLRIGLRLILNCAIVNERTKRAIELFVQRTTYGCSYLTEDALDESTSGEIWESSHESIGDRVKSTPGDDYSVEASGSGELNDSRDASLTLTNSTRSIVVSKASLVRSTSPYVATTEPVPSTQRGEATEGLIQNIVELSEEVGQSPSTEEPRAKATTEKTSECGRTNCTVNRCGRDRNCTESDCEDDDCGSASTASDNCEGEDCETDARVTPKMTVSSGNETTDRTSHGCEGLDCATNRTPKTTTPGDCQGDECSTQPSEKSCEGPDCQGSGMKMPGDDCEDDLCSESLIAEPCKGADCPAEVSDATLRPCIGESCSQSVELCDGEDCLTDNQETTTELAKTIEATTARVSTTPTQQAIVPLTKPMIICNNSDPHYQRKLNRLRKIRLIDALSSKSMSSYETFDKLLASTSRGRTNGPERTTSKTRVTDKTILTTDLSEETPAREVVPARHNLNILEMEEIRTKTNNEGKRKLIVKNLEQASPKRPGLLMTRLNGTIRTTKSPKEPRPQTTKLEATGTTKSSEKPGLLLTSLEETSWTTENPKIPRLQTTGLEETRRTTGNPEKPKLKMKIVKETGWVTKNPKKPKLQNSNLVDPIWQTKSPEEPEVQTTDLETSDEITKRPKAPRLQMEELEETRWTEKNPGKLRLKVEHREETSGRTKKPNRQRLPMEELEETRWTEKNPKKPRPKVENLEETSWTAKNPKKPRLQVTDMEETSWTAKKSKKPRLQVTDSEETSWTTKNLKKPRFQVTDMEETSWTTKNRKKPRLQVTDMEETSWTTKNRKKPRLEVTDMEETSWTTKNRKKPRLQLTDIEETSRTRKNPKKPRLPATDLEETSRTTKKTSKPRLQMEELEETHWTMKNPETQRLKIENLEETKWITKNPRKPKLPEEDLEETSQTMKIPKEPRLQATDPEETSWKTKVIKKLRTPVTDEDDIIWTKKNLSKPRPKVTQIRSKPTSLTKSHEEIISRPNDRERTASKRQNQRTTSFETNGPANTITEMKSMKKVSYKGRKHRNDPLLELLRSKGKSSRSAASTVERADQQSIGYDVSRSYNIEGSSNSEVEKRKSVRRLSDLEEDDSLMEKNGSSKKFSTTRHMVKSGSIKMDEGQAGGLTKTKRIVTSDGDDGEARDSISSEAMRGEYAKTIESSRGPKHWRWSARKRRVRIVPQNGINSYQSMIDQSTVVKPDRHFSKRVYKLQGSNKQTRTIQHVPEMHQVQEHESEFQEIGDDAPNIRKVRKWKIHEIGEDQPKIHKMSKHEVKIHEFGDDDHDIWEHDWQRREIKKKDKKIREDKIHRIRGRGSKIHGDTLNDQPEVYGMEDIEPTKISWKRVVRKETRKNIVNVPERQ